MTDPIEIDRLIRAWDERLQRVVDSLLALEADATYQALASSASPGHPAIEGLTAERARGAIDAMTHLFEQREQLTAVIDRAKEIRGSISPLSFWGNEERFREIDALLDGPSIRLRSESTSLAERQLLDPSELEVCLTPDDLLRQMVHTYEAARTTVTAVTHAWAKLRPALEEIERDVMQLKRRFASARSDASADVHRQLSDIDRDLAVVRRCVASDPLGAGSDLLRTLMVKVRDTAEALTAQAALTHRVDASTARAGHARQNLVHARAQAFQASREAERAFFLHVPLTPTDESLLEGLEAWWLKLQSTLAEGHLRAAEVGLLRFIEAVETYTRADMAIVATSEALVGRSLELRGRLSARKAQVEAIRGKLVAPAALAALAAL
ncbi:MAG: hypothetical protein NVSMB1_15750 [Polyangiales bacterium]